MTRTTSFHGAGRSFSSALALVLLVWACSPGYGAEWNIETVDSAGNTGQYSSIATGNGRVHISHFDVTNGNLRYAGRENGGPWTLRTIDKGANTGLHTSIGVNTSVHISYYKESSSQLKYASNETGQWVAGAIDSGRVVGEYTSILVDGNEKTHISYYKASDHSLKYATNMGGDWVLETVDDGGDNGDVGQCSSIAVDSRGRIHVSYRDVANRALKYAVKDSAGWHISTIDEAGDVGWFSAISIDSQDGIHISYWDATNGTLKYAGTTGTGSWQVAVLDPSGLVGGHISMAADNHGSLHISYYGVEGDNGDLRYATNASGSWVLETVERSSSDGGNAGRFTSIAVDDDRNPHISYYDVTNGDLKYASRSNPDISAAPAAIDFGTVPYAGLSAPRTVTVTNSGRGTLLVSRISLAGPESDAFIVTADTCTGNPVPPRGNCTIQLKFAPAAGGSAAASLQIRSDDPDTPLLAVALAGTGGATHTIAAAFGPGGIIAPMASVTLAEGGSQSFTIIPDRNFYIYDVLVDQVSVGTHDYYLFSNVTSDHLIEAFFASPFRIAGSPSLYFGTLQAACDAAFDGATVQTRAGTVNENLPFNRDRTVLLTGGFDPRFAVRPGATVLTGWIEVSDGGVEVESIGLE